LKFKAIFSNNIYHDFLRQLFMEKNKVIGQQEKGENPIGFPNKYYFMQIKCRFVVLKWYYFIS